VMLMVRIKIDTEIELSLLRRHDVTNQWWTVTLRADGDRYAHVNVSTLDEDSAIDAACQIELAPRRSVISVEPYEGEDI
jgi:hypothetical protein